MSPTLSIRLFGLFALAYGDEPVVALQSARLRSLLAYLVLHADTPQPRQHLAFLLWPDSSEEQARSNLRKLFFQLRQALPQPDLFLRADSYSIQWNPAAPYTLDVHELDQLLRQSEQNPLDRGTLVRIVELYAGELLPNCYDDWIVPLRQQLQRGVQRTLERLITLLENQRAYQEGVGYAQRLLELDPLEETSYQRLMRLRMLNGDRSGALRAYQECVRILQREIGVSPGLETQRVYEQLMGQRRQAQSIEAESPIQVDTAELVARTREWALLQAAWRRASQGHTQLVAITGEAGIGKTRLAEELLIWAAQQGVLTAHTRAYASQGTLAYAPLTALLRTPALSNRLTRLGTAWLVELARLMPELLESHPNLPHPEPMTDRWQRQRLYDALLQALLLDDQPLLLLFDDLQWCDPETLEWLQYALTARRTARLLFVGTVRTGEVETDHPLHTLRHTLRREERWQEMELEPLTADEVAALAAQVAGTALSPAQMAALYADSEGNPLFVVEIVRALTNRAGDASQVSPTSGTTPDDRVSALPPKVATVIETRLGQLSPQAKELVGIAAAIGRSFSFNVLLAASGLTEDVVVDALDELWRRRIVQEQGVDAYDFSHDRIRDVAYGLQTRARRRLLHRRIATALEDLYAADPDAVAGELAHHAEQAGQIEQAIHHLRRAAEVARRVGAYSEAVLRLRKAIALLRSLVIDQESATRQELAMRIPLGACLVALRGYGDSEVEATYTRAHQLCTGLGDDPNLMPTLVGLALYYLIRGELQQALRIGQQSLELAQRVQDDGLLLEAHLVVGPVLQYLGRFRESVTHLEQGLALYDPARHSSHAAVYGHEPGIACRVILAISLWFLGYADRSLRLMQEGLALAQDLSHPYTLNLAQTYNAQLYHLRREPVEDQRAASAGLELARQHGFQYWQAICTMFHGWAETHRCEAGSHSAGETEEVIQHMQAAFAGFERTGARLLAAYYRTVIAEAQIATDAVADGSATLDEALSIAAVAEDKFYLPELYRLRGELLQTQLGTAQAAAETERNAETAFQQAMCIAQAQGARTLELRAATSLARLWLRQGRRREAQDVLAERVGCFAEGLDTPDRRQAAALLQQLSSAKGPESLSEIQV